MTDFASSAIDRPVSLFSLSGLMLLLTLFQGCQTGNEPRNETGSTSSQQGKVVEMGEQKYRVRDLRSGGKSLRLTSDEWRDLRRTAANLATNFSSDDPEDWRQAAEKIQKMGKRVVPEVVLKKTKAATGKGTQARTAREQLVKWGRLKMIILRLPSGHEETWNEVRKEMLKRGPDAKQMFVSHMLRFLKKPNQHRSMAARQLARSGSPVVQNAWTTARRLSRSARNASRKDKSLKGVMVTITGLCQVIVYAKKWTLIQKALRHKLVRLRGGMVQALTKSPDPKRAVRLLVSKVRNDSNSWVRAEAVSSLELFNESDRAVEALANALLDDHERVATLAAKKLRYFPRKEEKVLSVLMKTLTSSRGRSISAQVRKKIFKTLRDVAEHPPSGDSLQAWTSWYKNQS